jgi:phage tail-like protein
MAGREDSLGVFSFHVTFGDIELAFRECGGMGSETEVVETKEVRDGKQIYEKSSGRTKWDNITLKRGMTATNRLWEWRQQVLDGDVAGARKNGSIVLYAPDGAITGIWNVENAWPSKLSGPSLNAGSGDIAVEDMVVVHEGCYREK